MSDEQKDVLARYLTLQREALVWKLSGLNEYDVRRPLTPTGSNLLGLVRHTDSVASEYFGVCLQRPFAEPMPWFTEDSPDNSDMWVPAEVTREDVLAFHDRVWTHADATVAALPLAAAGTVPWWPEERRHPTLHTLLVHMIAELARHAGHADLLRESIDAGVGVREGLSNLPDHDAAWWSGYVAQVQAAADAHR